jgi:hypothetical protein
MRARLLLLGCALVATPAVTTPASAVRIGAGVSGGIAVDSTLGACASLTFSRPTTGAGLLSSSGVLSGPGTIVGVVRGAVPVVLVGATSWSACLPNAYAGATIGYATYQLVVTTVDGEFAETQHCVVSSGHLTCT